MLDRVISKYRSLVFKSMNGWLTDNEQAFVNATAKLFYGACRCGPHTPSPARIKTLVKNHKV